MLTQLALASLLASPLSPPAARAQQSAVLYVVGPAGALIYSQSTLQLVGAFSGGFDDPNGVTVDAAGNVYVANPYFQLFFQSFNDVAIYPPGTTYPTATVTDGLVNPQASAIAPDGTLYVVDTYTHNVTVFAKGSKRFTRMEFPTHGAPQSIAVDGSGNVYVGYQDVPYDGTSHIAEFAPGQRKGTVLPLSFASLSALAIDAQGNLLAADPRAGTIAVYPPGATSPSAVLSGFSQGIFSMSLNAAGNTIFVANGYEVDEVTYPAGKLLGKIPGYGVNVFGVAASPALVPGSHDRRRAHAAAPAEDPVASQVDANARPQRGWLAPNIREIASTGLLYVATGANTVDVFPRDQSRQLVGQITQGVSNPSALATDARNDLYVANAKTNTVTVYPPGSTQPSVTYSNGIDGPNGLAVDSKGTLYVSNGAGQSVTEYPAGSTSPSLTISGIYTLGLGVDGKDNLYDLVAGASGSDFTASVYEFAPGSTKGVFTGIDLASTLGGASGMTVSANGTIAVLFGDVICFPPGKTTGQFFSLGNAGAATFSKGGERIWATDTAFATADEIVYPFGNHDNAIDINSTTGIAVTGT